MTSSVSTTASLMRLEDEKCGTSSLRVVSRYHLLTFKVSGFKPCVIWRLCESFWFHNFLVKFQINAVSRESHRLIIVVLDALSACSEEFFVHRLILQTPVGFDVDIVTTTLGEKEGKTLRNLVITTMHMSNVIIFMDE